MWENFLKYLFSLIRAVINYSGNDANKLYTKKILFENTGSSRGVLGCDIMVSKFEFQFRYYVNFQTKALKESIIIIIMSCQ